MSLQSCPARSITVVSRSGSQHCAISVWRATRTTSTRKLAPDSWRYSSFGISDGKPAIPGDEELATAKLGRAVKLAQDSGNDDTAKLLAKVVDVVDAATGTVRLKRKVDDADEMALDTRSTKTVRTKR